MLHIVTNKWVLSAGSIDYEEFLAATVNLNHLEKEETMYNAFQYFDTDNSGYITEQEMEDALRVRHLHSFNQSSDRLINQSFNQYCFNVAYFS